MELKDYRIDNSFCALRSYWSNQTFKLKYKYEPEYNNEVKVYKLSKEEMEEYLKKFR